MAHAVINDPRRFIACTEVEKNTVSEKILKNIGTELKIGTDSDANLFINFKWPNIEACTTNLSLYSTF
jgi:hypothetical protein